MSATEPAQDSPSILEEMVPMLKVSALVYSAAKIIRDFRSGITLNIPEGAPYTQEDIDRLDFMSCDLRRFNKKDGDSFGNGLSFSQLFELVDANKEYFESGRFEEDRIEFFKAIREYFDEYEGSPGENPADKVFLTTFRCFRRNVSCVYALLKDTVHKRMIVVFRGSQLEGRDWRTNANFTLTAIETPAMIKDKMNGNLQERILVHSGCHEYLFDNPRLDGDAEERFERIMKDMMSVFEDGYRVYVTGHSLGGGLATMFSFNLAANPEYEKIVRPVTLIDFCSPMFGTDGYRQALEQMEVDRLLRHLRVVNTSDIVPTFVPTSIGIPFFHSFRTMKHHGINLRLWNGNFRMTHSSKGGFMNAIGNSLLKNPFTVFSAHSLGPLLRMALEHEELKTVSIEDLYMDENVVSKEFLERMSGVSGPIA